KGFHILLVEDSLDNQELIMRQLLQAGATVRVAGSGMEGLRLASEEFFDAVLMDIQMPELDGFQTVALLRSKGYSRPIAALTAHALRTEIETAADKGFDGYLTKPVDRNLLIQEITRLVRLRANG